MPASQKWGVTDLPPLRESRLEIPLRVLRECKVSGFVAPLSSGIVDSQLRSPCRNVIGFSSGRLLVSADCVFMRVDADQRSCRVDFKHSRVRA